MGRVYNALVRAERWSDRDRPIGAPAQGDASSQPNHALAEVVATREPIGVGSTEPAGAASAPLPRRAGPLSPRSLFESSAASLPPAAAFEEPSEVASITGLTVDPHLAAVTGEDAPAVERYRTLAAGLLKIAERRKLKTLLITSAEATEGKTTVAINLAWSLARNPGRRVLLIAGSLSSSSASRMLGIDPKRGWLNLAKGSCKPKDAMVRLDPSGLYVMTSGAQSAAQSSDALSSRLEDVISDLAPRFDMVVVDSLPILESSEPQRLATVLDGTVIVARACHTHHRKVTAARKLVPKERRLGLVLNESDVDAARKRERSSLAGRLFGGARGRA